jgi:hypothetical protein
VLLAGCGGPVARRPTKTPDPSAVADKGQAEVNQQRMQGQEKKQDSQRDVQTLGGTSMIEAREIDGELWIKASDHHRAIAELESQEPVEWGVDWGKDGNSVSIIKRLANGNIEVLAWEYAPHPPQRTWVGLTDDEIDTWNIVGHESLREFVRAIEAKLKEKNNA